MKFLTLFAAALVLGPAFAQAPSRVEKREAKVRSEYLKLTADLHVPTITAAELKAQLDDTNLVIVDVRGYMEQIPSMLPKALTTGQFASGFHYGGVPKGKRIVTYCTLGNRAGQYAEQLIAKGLHVQNLEGGIMAWTFVGGPLVGPDGNGGQAATKKVHVFAKDMRDWIAPDYEAVW